MIYLGIDPGVSGGLAAINGFHASAVSMPGEAEAWEWLEVYRGTEAFALIEQQVPRPTFWKGRPQGSILRSTCLLYGNYCLLRGFLVAGQVPFEDCPPKRWQSLLGIPAKKGEARTAWKNRLKSRAAQLFPRLKVTLDTADALLLAEAARRIHQGALTREKPHAASS